MSFLIYLVGCVVLIVGPAIGAHLLHVPQQWIGVGILCLVGVAIIHGVTATRHEDSVSWMKTIVLGTVSLLFSADLLATSLSAQELAIDTKQPTLTIHVGKAGMFSSLGHEHEIRGVIDSGNAETGAHPSVEVHVDARALKVIDKDESDKARAEVQATMLGPEVLDSERFKEIVFKSTSAESAGEGKWTLTGDLTLHGQTKPATVHVTLKDGRYTGEALVKQTDFGIKPPGMAGVRAKDEVRIEFDVQLAR